jgi:hypothetical protein
MRAPARFVIGLLIGLVAGGTAAGAWFWAKGREEFRVEAVKAGHARYRIKDDYGRTEFEWLPAGDGIPK